MKVFLCRKSKEMIVVKTGLHAKVSGSQLIVNGRKLKPKCAKLTAPCADIRLRVRESAPFML